jgi:SAM-dependent methyltransferase
VRELGRVLAKHGSADVLNVGSGPFLELGDLPDTGARFSLVDIDPRAIAVARDLHGARLVRTDVIAPGAPLPYDDASFDLVVSMDVVEHVRTPEPWCREIVRVLRPGGALFLTTPNYGFSTLGLLERTALEAIARMQGFSRRDLHPSKLSRRRLQALLARAGFLDVRVRRIAFAWVLAAHATKPWP